MWTTNYQLSTANCQLPTANQPPNSQLPTANYVFELSSSNCELPTTRLNYQVWTTNYSRAQGHRKINLLDGMCSDGASVIR